MIDRDYVKELLKWLVILLVDVMIVGGIVFSFSWLGGN